jgi:hypothetical protein
LAVWHNAARFRHRFTCSSGIPEEHPWQTLIVIFMRLNNLSIVAVANAAALLLHLGDLIFLSAKLFTAKACCDNSFEIVAGGGSSSYN